MYKRWDTHLVERVSILAEVDTECWGVSSGFVIDKYVYKYLPHLRVTVYLHLGPINIMLGRYLFNP